MKTRNKIALETAQALHEYFEHVRTDVLAVPDSDVTAALILSAFDRLGEGDTRRLDWLEKHAEEIYHAAPVGGDASYWTVTVEIEKPITKLKREFACFAGDSPRAAIDAALTASKEGVK